LQKPAVLPKLFYQNAMRILNLEAAVEKAKAAAQARAVPQPEP